jgi:hypothetical protein
MGQLERATIYVMSVDKQGKATKDQPTTGIPVCFNPKEYSLEKSVDWSAEKALTDAPQPEFKNPKPMSLSVTLQFDTYEERISVRDKYIKAIEKLALLRGKLDKGGKNAAAVAPPVILFVWGRFSFQGVINSLNQKYTMFLADGTPVRAEVALKIQNVLDTNLDTGTAATVSAAQNNTKSYSVNDGDRLDLIAATELGDASRWAEIAMLNGIQDPVTMDSLKSLKIPSE